MSTKKSINSTEIIREKIRELLGHSHLSTTEEYLKRFAMEKKPKPSKPKQHGHKKN